MKARTFENHFLMDDRLAVTRGEVGSKGDKGASLWVIGWALPPSLWPRSLSFLTGQWVVWGCLPPPLSSSGILWVRRSVTCGERMVYCSGSQSAVPRSTSASPRNLVRMQILRSHSGSTESETWGWGPAIYVLTSLPRHSNDLRLLFCFPSSSPCEPTVQGQSHL